MVLYSGTFFLVIMNSRMARIVGSITIPGLQAFLANFEAGITKLPGLSSLFVWNPLTFTRTMNCRFTLENPCEEIECERYKEQIESYYEIITMIRKVRFGSNSVMLGWNTPATIRAGTMAKANW